MKKIKRTAICAAVFLLACHNGSVSGCVTAQAGIKVVQTTSDVDSMMENMVQPESWNDGGQSFSSRGFSNRDCDKPVLDESLDINVDNETSNKNCDKPVLDGGLDINVDNDTIPGKNNTTNNEDLKDEINEGINKPPKGEQGNGGQTTNPAQPGESATINPVQPKPPTNPDHGTDPDKNKPTVPDKDNTISADSTPANPDGSPSTKPGSSTEVKPGNSGEAEVKPGNPSEAEVKPANPSEAEGKPGNPGEAEGKPAKPGNPGEAEGKPAKPGEAEVKPANPSEAEVKPANPSEAEVKPANPGEAEVEPVKTGGTETRPASSDDLSAEPCDQPILDTNDTEILKVSTEKVSANESGKLTTNYVTVYTDTKGEFTADSEASWIKVGTNGGKLWQNSVSMTGSNRIYISTDKYKGSKARSGKITVTHRQSGERREITVVQNPCKELLDIDRLEKTADPDGSFFNNTVTVRTLGTGSFTVEVDDPAGWLAVSAQDTEQFGDGESKLTFQGDGVFYLVAAANGGENRTARITVAHGKGGLKESILVTQLGYKNTPESKKIVVNREIVDFQEAKEASSKVIRVWTDADVRWTAVTEDKWIQIVQSSIVKKGNKALEGKGFQEFYIRVAENYNCDTRYGFIKIRSEGADGKESMVIAVSQGGALVNLHELLDQVGVLVPRETFEKGKTTRIQLQYPDGLYPSDIAKTTYASGKPKVASVNKKGVIKGKQNGTAVIYVKACLEDGYSKQMKLKVTVGKRKVETMEVL